MEHIKIQDLGNGYSKLTPDAGYLLFNARTQQTYKQAIVKDIRPFRAIEL